MKIILNIYSKSTYVYIIKLNEKKEEEMCFLFEFVTKIVDCSNISL